MEAPEPQFNHAMLVNFLIKVVVIITEAINSRFIAGNQARHLLKTPVARRQPQQPRAQPTHA